MNIDTMMNLVMTCSGLTIVVTEYISNLFGTKGNVARIISWLVSVSMVFLSSWIGINSVEELNWKGCIITGLMSGLVANGLFSIEMVKNLLVVLKIRNIKKNF